MFVWSGNMRFYKEIYKDYPLLMSEKDIVGKPEFNRDLEEQEYIRWYNVPAAFDIETTSYNGYGNMYIWQFGINGWLYYGRTWEQFFEFYNFIVSQYELSHEKRLIVFIHNASFDLSFLLLSLDWENMFNMDSRKPLYARTTEGVEFRCSYLQSGVNLATLASMCTKYPCQKMVGDLDYSLIRHSETELTEEEKKYCQEDIRILCNYYKEQIEKEKYVFNVPLTKTGYVRRDVYNRTIKQSKKYRELIHRLNMKLEDYDNLIRPAFMGGYTHCSALQSKKLHKNVFHIDFTSSYPYCLLAFKYPCSRPLKDDNIKTIDDIKKKVATGNFGFIFTIEIDNLEDKFFYEHYLSISHCKFKVDGDYISERVAREKYVTVDNGRIINCTCTLETTITDLDWNIIEQVYTYTQTRITNLVKFNMQYLPYELIDTILYYYEQKTTLKGIPGKDEEYSYYKSLLNSIYGFLCQEALKQNYTFNGSWKKNVILDREDAMEKYNNNGNRSIYYPFGVYCTANARANLWGANPCNKNNNFGILQLKEDYIYTDTDSIFGTNFDKYKTLYDNYNSQVVENLKGMCAHYQIDFNRCQPKNKKGNRCLIGIWDREQDLQLFKSLGCKRYATYCTTLDEKDKIQGLDVSLTVSGVNKKVAVPYLWEQANKDVNKYFELFDEGLVVPGAFSGKMMPTYTDSHYDYDLTDYQGKTYHVSEESGVYLESKAYSLTMTEDYVELLMNLAIGNQVLEED